MVLYPSEEAHLLQAGQEQLDPNGAMSHTSVVWSAAHPGAMPSSVVDAAAGG